MSARRPLSIHKLPGVLTAEPEPQPDPVHIIGQRILFGAACFLLGAALPQLGTDMRRRTIITNADESGIELAPPLFPLLLHKLARKVPWPTTSARRMRAAFFSRTRTRCPSAPAIQTGHWQDHANPCLIPGQASPSGRAYQEPRSRLSAIGTGRLGHRVICNCDSSRRPTGVLRCPRAGQTRKGTQSSGRAQRRANSRRSSAAFQSRRISPSRASSAMPRAAAQSRFFATGWERSPNLCGCGAWPNKSRNLLARLRCSPALHDNALGNCHGGRFSHARHSAREPATRFAAAESSRPSITRTLPGRGAAPSLTRAAASRHCAHTPGDNKSARDQFSRAGFDAGFELPPPCKPLRRCLAEKWPRAFRSSASCINGRTLHETSSLRPDLLARFTSHPYRPRLLMVCSIWSAAFTTLRTGLIRSLRHDHVHEFRDHADVRLLEHPLHDRSQAFAATGRPHDRIARCRGRKKQIAARAVQPSGVIEQRQLQRPHLLRRGLSRQRHADRAIGAHRHRGRARGNSDRRLTASPS